MQPNRTAAVSAAATLPGALTDREAGRHLRLGGVALLLLGSLATGDLLLARAAATPTVDQILEKFVQAIGGQAACEKISSRVMKATLESPTLGGSMPWEMYSKAPNKQLSTFEITGFGVIRDAFDGRVAWSQSPMGLREKSDDELLKVKRDAEFYRDLDLKKHYPGLAVQGTAKVGAEDAYRLESSPTPTSRETLYFGARSGLMLRADSEYATSTGKVQASALLEDYRPVDGVKVPFLIRLTLTTPEQPEMSLIIKCSEVQHNVPIDDAKFAKPKG
jgi:hypothetical protein